MDKFVWTLVVKFKKSFIYSTKRNIMTWATYYANMQLYLANILALLDHSHNTITNRGHFYLLRGDIILSSALWRPQLVMMCIATRVFSARHAILYSTCISNNNLL